MAEKAFNWCDRPVLVTGASGFLGGWLVKSLLEQEAEVVVLVRDGAPKARLFADKLIGRVSAVYGDICDQALLERALGEYEVKTVFHLAAQTIVPIANRNPVSTFESNIRGTWSLLEACRRSPLVSEVVLASSDKAYGAQKELPYSEDMPLKGVFPYDVSKACADMLAASYASTYGLPVVVTRCGNFFGGGDLNFNRLVPGTIRSALKGEKPIIRSDGKYMRDYFYIEDGAGAYMLLAEKLAEDRSLAGEAFNFSNETQLSVLELVEMILELMEADLEPEILCEAEGEIIHQYLSAAKARRLLGWKPLYNLKDGLEKTIKWYRRYLEK